jgi:hypothetical protein
LYSLLIEVDRCLVSFAKCTSEKQTCYEVTGKKSSYTKKNEHRTDISRVMLRGCQEPHEGLKFLGDLGQLNQTNSDNYFGQPVRNPLEVCIYSLTVAPRVFPSGVLFDSRYSE